MWQKLKYHKVKKIAEETGLPVIAVLVRGGENHVKSLCLENGKVVLMLPDGTLKPSEFGHNIKDKLK